MRQTCLRRLKTSPRHLQNFNVGVIWRNQSCEKYDLQGPGTEIELLYKFPMLFLSTVLNRIGFFDILLFIYLFLLQKKNVRRVQMQTLLL